MSYQTDPDAPTQVVAGVFGSSFAERPAAPDAGARRPPEETGPRRNARHAPHQPPLVRHRRRRDPPGAHPRRLAVRVDQRARADLATAVARDGLARAVDLAQRGLLGLYVAISTQRVLIGFAIGGALGLVIGAVVGLSRLGDILLAPTLGAIRAVPSLAWIPLLILWFKIGEESKIILISIGAFFPVYTIVASSLRHVDRHLIEAGRAFGLSGVRLFTSVQLPAVVPSVISGLRLALAQSWLFLVAAELIASSMGLGFLLNDSGQNGRIDRIFLAIILLAVLGKLTDALVGLFEKWAVRKWA